MAVVAAVELVAREAAAAMRAADSRHQPVLGRRVGAGQAWVLGRVEVAGPLQRVRDLVQVAVELAVLDCQAADEAVRAVRVVPVVVLEQVDRESPAPAGHHPDKLAISWIFHASHRAQWGVGATRFPPEVAAGQQPNSCRAAPRDHRQCRHVRAARDRASRSFQESVRRV